MGDKDIINTPPVSEEELTRPVLLGDLVEATKSLRESIDAEFVTQETMAGLRQVLTEMIEYSEHQSHFFGATIGALAFVLAAEHLITEEELEMLTDPDFDTQTFLRGYVKRKYGIDLDKEQAKDPDDDLPTGVC